MSEGLLLDPGGFEGLAHGSGTRGRRSIFSSPYGEDRPVGSNLVSTPLSRARPPYRSAVNTCDLHRRRSVPPAPSQNPSNMVDPVLEPCPARRPCRDHGRLKLAREGVVHSTLSVKCSMNRSSPPRAKLRSATFTYLDVLLLRHRLPQYLAGRGLLSGARVRRGRRRGSSDPGGLQGFGLRSAVSSTPSCRMPSAAAGSIKGRISISAKGVNGFSAIRRCGTSGSSVSMIPKPPPPTKNSIASKLSPCRLNRSHGPPSALTMVSGIWSGGVVLLLGAGKMIASAWAIPPVSVREISTHLYALCESPPAVSRGRG